MTEARLALTPNGPTARATPHPDVHIGQDGWLFLTGGNNGVLDQFGRPGFPRKRLWKWRQLLGWRRRACARIGAAYFHVVAPEKLTILHEVAGLDVDPNRSPALRLQRWARGSHGALSLVDLVRPLRAARAGALPYLRTDSHWSFEGGLVVYRALCRAFGVAPFEDLVQRRIVERFAFSGDLALKLQPAPIETVDGCRFATSARRVHANGFLRQFEASGRVTQAHLGTQIVFENADPRVDPRRLVIFGDSYAHFMPLNAVATLTPLLADRFREVHFLWSPSIDWTYLDAVRPDIVLTEIAERFMIELPPCGFRIDALAELALSRKTPF